MAAFRNLVFCVATLLASVSAASAGGLSGLNGGANVSCNYGSTLQDAGDIRVLRDE